MTIKNSPKLRAFFIVKPPKKRIKKRYIKKTKNFSKKLKKTVDNEIELWYYSPVSQKRLTKMNHKNWIGKYKIYNVPC